MTNRLFVHKYYEAWVKGDRDRVQEMLDENLKFKSPMDNFNTAEAFLEKCWVFQENFNEVIYKKEIYDDHQAFVMYLASDGKSPAKTLVAEYLQMKAGKIIEVDVVSIKPYAPSAH